MVWIKLLDRRCERLRGDRAVGLVQCGVIDVDRCVSAHRDGALQRVTGLIRAEADGGDLAAKLLLQFERGFEGVRIVAVHHRGDPGRRNHLLGRLVDLEVGRRDVWIGDLLDRDDDVHRGTSYQSASAMISAISRTAKRSSTFSARTPSSNMVTQKGQPTAMPLPCVATASFSRL